MTPREGVVLIDRADVLKALRDALNVTDNRVTQAFGKPWLDDAASRIMAIQPAHPAATAREEAIRAEVIEECARACEGKAARYGVLAKNYSDRSDRDGTPTGDIAGYLMNLRERSGAAAACADAIRALALARSTGGAP